MFYFVTRDRKDAFFASSIRAGKGLHLLPDRHQRIIRKVWIKRRHGMAGSDTTFDEMICRVANTGNRNTDPTIRDSIRLMLRGSTLPLWASSPGWYRAGLRVCASATTAWPWRGAPHRSCRRSRWQAQKQRPGSGTTFGPAAIYLPSARVGFPAGRFRHRSFIARHSYHF